MLESVSLLVDVLAELTLPDVSVEGVVELVLVLLGVGVVRDQKRRRAIRREGGAI